jgi:hypothetical protein
MEDIQRLLAIAFMVVFFYFILQAFSKILDVNAAEQRVQAQYADFFKNNSCFSNEKVKQMVGYTKTEFNLSVYGGIK